MKLFTKTIAAAALAGTAAIATPAAAQVAGIATSSPEAVIVRSQARIAAYQQIDQQFAAQIGQIRTLRQEMQTLQQSLDTDSNGQLSQAELQANPGVVQQIQQKEQQLGQASQPIVLAQTYAIEQLINDYQNVRQQVVQQKNIQLLLTPDAIQWAPEAVNVTDDLVAVLDQRVPTVQITPPEGWRPRQDSLAAQQTVSQVLMNVAQQQAAQQQAQQQQQQPAAQPAGR
ncbi:OmpH family outer membrane protein [Erythrobacter citreus]|uniref:OmpH family outer membrane protein n=1 Tax=Qipengyuania citrea TaxID=225971 RepID=A0A6I4UET4_9SPHN|nr:OmpH family outer membrane protein [Qipengyuania citrea]MDQ0564789.1 Skp family chaperone for outer membrane proteins [Qipengyuania citrea]MXP36185.1 OmpH family outer membrane protein [Qipengyuania citrea]